MPRRGGGYESGSMTVSEMLEHFPEALKRPGAGVATPEPQDAPPRVPTLPCLKCGEPDTTMRYCDGRYSLTWGVCADKGGDHFHRGCPRCTRKWITHDTLDGQHA